MTLVRAVRGLVTKETHHILRDWKTLLVVLLIPVAQVVLFGYAIQTDLENVRLLVVAPDPDAAARALVDRFAASDRYTLVGTASSVDAVGSAFRSNRADQALVLPPSLGERAREPSGAEVLVLTDAASPTTGRGAEGFARAVVGAWQGTLGAGRSSTPAPVVEIRTRFLFNPTLESQYIFVPGLLAFVLTIISALMTAVTLSREKEMGTMEVLLTSPLRPWQIILGKILPYLLLAFLNAVSTLVVAWVLFQVPMRGSLVLVLAESLLFVVLSLSLGILVSTLAPTQRAAMLFVIVGTMLPTALLSGMIFPIASMPGWLVPLTHVIPAKWFIRIIKGILLKDAGFLVLWRETAILAAMTTVLLTVSIATLKERLE